MSHHLHLSPSVRRLLALAIPVLLLGMVYAMLVRPSLAELSANSKAVSQLTDSLARYRQIAARGPELAQQADELRKTGAESEGYLPGESEAVAGAALQDRLKGLVARSGGQLGSIQILPAQQEGDARRITARGEMTLGTEGLRQVLYSIESDQPYLFIDSIDVRGAAGPAGGDAALDIRFDVTGYMRGQS